MRLEFLDAEHFATPPMKAIPPANILKGRTKPGRICQNRGLLEFGRAGSNSGNRSSLGSKSRSNSSGVWSMTRCDHPGSIEIIDLMRGASIVTRQKLWKELQRPRGRTRPARHESVSLQPYCHLDLVCRVPNGYQMPVYSTSFRTPYDEDRRIRLHLAFKLQWHG
jgi:hypothetical protein